MVDGILRVRHKNTRNPPRKLFTKVYKDVCLDWVHIHQITRADLPGAGVLILADSVFVPSFLAGLVPLLLAAVFILTGSGLFHLLDDAFGGRVLFAQGGDLAG